MDRKKVSVVAVLKQGSDNKDVVSQFLKLINQGEGMETASIFLSGTGQKDIISEIKALHPDFLVTTDLQGFEQCTLTDTISYNLLDCKQFHLLLHDRLPNECFLGRQLSIAMFFYCVGNSYCEYLERRYPNLPYLKALQGWRTDAGEDAIIKNAVILYEAFQEALALSMLKGSGGSVSGT